MNILDPDKMTVRGGILNEDDSYPLSIKLVSYSKYYTMFFSDMIGLLFGRA